LLVKESFDFNRGFKRWSLEFTDLRFCLICELQLRRLSNISPRYFTSSVEGITRLLNVTGGQTNLRNVKVTWEDFVSFIFIFHRLVHRFIMLRWLWIIRQAVAESWCDAEISVSSAYVPRKVKGVLGMSWVNTEYRKGAISLRWGTPALMRWLVE
jgi:hypothetical protein